MVEVKEINLEDIIISESNTRKDLKAGTEDAGIEELAQSIRENGLLSPIIVIKRDDEKYELIVGQRRYLACQLLGMKSIAAIIRDKMDSTDATILSLVENVHRADMNPIDKTQAFQKIYEKYNDYRKVAKEVGLAVSTVKRYMSLLKLAPHLQEKVTTSDGFAGIATLSRVAENFATEEQEKVFETVGGFKQQIQLEMIKRSGGDINKLSELKEQALDGAFDVKICRGLEYCTFLEPDELEFLRKYQEYKETNDEEIELANFKEVVKRLKSI